jgi:hypothetical protein
MELMYKIFLKSNLDSFLERTINMTSEITADDVYPRQKCSLST